MSQKTIKMNLELQGLSEIVTIYGEDIKRIKRNYNRSSKEKELTSLFKSYLILLFKYQEKINSTQYKTVKGMINKDNQSVKNFIRNRLEVIDRSLFNKSIKDIENKYSKPQPEDAFEIKLSEPTNTIIIELYKKGDR